MADTNITGALGRAALPGEPRRSPAPPSRCPSYSWCVESGPHAMHVSAELAVTMPSGYGLSEPTDRVLDFRLMAEDGGIAPQAGFCEADMTPAEVRAKVAELRAHLDRVEAQLAFIQSGPFGS